MVCASQASLPRGTPTWRSINILLRGWRLGGTCLPRRNLAIQLIELAPRILRRRERLFIRHTLDRRDQTPNRGQAVHLLPLNTSQFRDTPQVGAREHLDRQQRSRDVRRTVAIEIPVWLTEEEIASLEQEHNIELVPKVTPQGQTQHVAQILRIGKHELELQLDRNATGITLEEPSSRPPHWAGRVTISG
jgi:hypothetical protein